MHRGAIAEIDLSAIAQNFHTVQEIVRGRPVIGVVKADAYGHGAVEVSKRLAGEGIPYLAVAFTEEARELREAGVSVPIIVLFDHGEAGVFFDLGLIPVIHNPHTAAILSAEATRRGSVLDIHIEVDTGMGRLGLHSSRVFQEIAQIASMPGVRVKGLMSHFSEADLSDTTFAAFQLERFQAVRDILSARLGTPVLCHFANSAAVLSFGDAHFDGVRPGLMLYGYSPFTAGGHPGSSQEHEMSKALTPAMTVKARLLAIRDLPAGTPVSYGRTFVTERQSKIGVVAMGYADGYPRSLSNNAEMLAQGRRVPVVGRVCMDLTMVDLTGIEGVRESDDVIVIGTQGNESITADELARKAGTISYEILTSLGGKSRKIYPGKER